ALSLCLYSLSLHVALPILGTDRFLREVRIVGQLRHPHILPLLDSGTAVGGGLRLPFYTMPVASGQTLRTLAAQGPLPATSAVALDRKSTRLNSSHVKISYA